jgi:hypothetical protein
MPTTRNASRLSVYRETDAIIRLNKTQEQINEKKIKKFTALLNKGN